MTKIREIRLFGSLNKPLSNKLYKVVHVMHMLFSCQFKLKYSFITLVQRQNNLKAAQLSTRSGHVCSEFQSILIPLYFLFFYNLHFLLNIVRNIWMFHVFLSKTGLYILSMLKIVSIIDYFIFFMLIERTESLLGLFKVELRLELAQTNSDFIFVVGLGCCC